MRDKPEPECVDNQALSLCLSTTLVGYLFSRGPQPSPNGRDYAAGWPAPAPRDARRHATEWVHGRGQRLHELCGRAGRAACRRGAGTCRWLPTTCLRCPSSRAGEARQTCCGWSPTSFMPGGLMLPVGQLRLPVRHALDPGLRCAAHGARDLFYEVLDNEVIWTYDIGIGWAYDDLVWTLIWWPAGHPTPPATRRAQLVRGVGGGRLRERRRRPVRHADVGRIGAEHPHPVAREPQRPCSLTASARQSRPTARPPRAPSTASSSPTRA